ncbi:peptidoglycan-binding protein [Afifella sp. H1R]|uniref:peptidoglycan-binding protein n=1 Tax=Afifella sp. H1R TaxID=2908841 RepID=UPI001F2616F5|nr:peptidoglycan-binding protein [Afifella sp. H1R]MCF1502891.1 peptidoglycan-binding protein [Afifella sp. H1R]
MLTEAQLRAVVGRRASAAILRKVAASGDILARFDLARSHRLAQFLAQIAYESARFRTTTEYASGAAYEGREDLGNTEKGDGVRFKGHGLIQTTGRYNHRRQTAWLRANGFPGCPDFEVEPDKASDFPWALLGAVWYWQSRGLSAYADRGDIEMITRRINGGLNGYQDRIDLYVRFALVILGYELTKGAIKRFQQAAGLVADDIAGPKTRAELHRQLEALPPLMAAEPVQETDMSAAKDIIYPKPSPVRQTSKAHGAAGGGIFGTVLTPMLIGLGVKFGLLPAAFGDPDVQQTLTVVVTALSAWIGTYIAPKNAE